jgi:hypothetical protein
MKAKSGFGKKQVIVFVITFLLAAALWGSGFTFLDQPDWSGGVDRPVYTTAVSNFFAQKNLYLDPSQPLPLDLRYYNYSPIAVFSVGLLSLLPPVILYLLHFLGALGLFFAWRTILGKIGIKFPGWVIPIWFIFAPFVYDALTLNVNIFMALLATLFLLFLSKEGRFAKAGAILVLFLLISTKPQWAAFALLPLVQRKWKDFLQIVAASAVLYGIALGAAVLFTSPQYVLSQHIMFFQHLGTFTRRFTYWNLPPGPYEYNNAIHQVFIYLLGDVKTGLTVTGYVQLVLFAALAGIFAWTVFQKQVDDSPDTQEWNLVRWFFILFCATLLYPPQVFDFSLGLALFLFLANRGRVQKILIGIPLAFVAFQDVIRAILGMGLNFNEWFPFTFTAVVISLFFLLTGKAKMNKSATVQQP